MSAQPMFVESWKISSATLKTASDYYDGTGAVTLVTAGAKGARIHGITGMFTGDVSTTSVVRVLLNNGGVFTPLWEATLPLYTKALDVGQPVFDLLYLASSPYIETETNAFYLPPNLSLSAVLTQTIENNLKVSVYYGDY